MAEPHKDILAGKKPVDWEKPPRFLLVAIDAEAAGWLDTDAWRKLKELDPEAYLTACFIVDTHERTYCCEITPSYWLAFHHASLYLRDAEELGITEAKRANIQCQWEHECWDYQDDSGYHHCHVVQNGRNYTVIETWEPDPVGEDDDPITLDHAHEAFNQGSYL